MIYRQALILPDRHEVYLYDELCNKLHVKMGTITEWESCGKGGRGCKYPGFPARVKTPVGKSFELPNGKTTHNFWYKSELDDWLLSTKCCIDIPSYAYRLSDIKVKYTSKILQWHSGKLPYPSGFPPCRKTLLDVSYFYKNEVDEWFAKNPEYTGKFIATSDEKEHKKAKKPSTTPKEKHTYTMTRPAELASPLMGFVVQAIDLSLRERVSKPLSYDKACFLQEAWEKLGYANVTIEELREDHAA